jgi:eukaryotic-like serine/threonine-protein kinase
LADADKGNAGWQADLAASHGKIGQMLLANKQPREALDSFQKGRAIIAPLAARAPDLVRWQNYLRGFDAEIARAKAAGG